MGPVCMDFLIADHFHANVYIMVCVDRDIQKVRKKFFAVTKRFVLLSLSIGSCSANTMPSYRCTISGQDDNRMGRTKQYQPHGDDTPTPLYQLPVTTLLPIIAFSYFYSPFFNILYSFFKNEKKPSHVGTCILFQNHF